MRRFHATKTVGLSDVDATGRLRLDVVARLLQDVASEDVIDVGRPPSKHFWIVRRTELEVVEPFRDDLTVEFETWASRTASTAAARRYTLRGSAGGHIEAESVWIHLDRDLRPLRLDDGFREIYGPSTEGRRVSTRLTLPPPTVEPSQEWPLRVVDVDRRRPARPREQRRVLGAGRGGLRGPARRAAARGARVPQADRPRRARRARGGRRQPVARRRRRGARRCVNRLRRRSARRAQNPIVETGARIDQPEYWARNGR